MNNNIKRNDQINLLKICREFTDTGQWSGSFTYPDCGPDLVRQGLATEGRQITTAGRAALWLLGEGDDPTDSKAVETFTLNLRNRDENQE